MQCARVTSVITLLLFQRRIREYAEETPMLTFTIAGRGVELDSAAVERSLAAELPEPIHEHYVVVGGRRFPPKQVITLVTGLDRADFTTHQARRVLQRLGFPAARRLPAPARRLSEPPAREGGAKANPLVEALRPFIGKWVAVSGDEVLVAADTPKEVVGWLTRHGLVADSMFGVPRSDADIFGAAPY